MQDAERTQEVVVQRWTKKPMDTGDPEEESKAQTNSISVIQENFLEEEQPLENIYESKLIAQAAWLSG